MNFALPKRSVTLAKTIIQAKV